MSAADIENKENQIPATVDWKYNYEQLQAQIEEQKNMFIQLMEEQKQSFMGQINDLENKIKKLTEDLKAAQAASTSDSSN